MRGVGLTQALPGDALGTGKGGRDDAANWDHEEENDVA
jgi:hypothetical protein